VDKPDREQQHAMGAAGGGPANAGIDHNAVLG